MTSSILLLEFDTEAQRDKFASWLSSIGPEQISPSFIRMQPKPAQEQS